MNGLRRIWCADLGLMDFHRAHELQLEILNARVSRKLNRDVVLVVEHHSVFTVGRRGNRAHLKVPVGFLKDAGVDLLHVERGGDITFHGPGQLVLYPIFHLAEAGIGVIDLVEKLEEVMIRTAEDVGVSARRNPRNRGVWTGDRKFGFVGIAVRRSVSFHGIALNVDLSLEPFTWINPCGLENVHVTSLKMEADKSVTIELAKSALMRNFERVFLVSLLVITTNKLKDEIQLTPN